MRPLRLLRALSTRPGTPDYPTHAPLSPWQRAAVAVAASLGAAANPHRADLVAAAADATGGGAWRAGAARMAASGAGAAILQERRRVTAATLAAAAAAPPASFGAAYAAFMRRRALNPDDRPPVRYVAGGADAAYAALRARESHDYWHTLFSCPTTVAGELALKALEAAHLGLPSAGAAVVGAAWRLSAEDRRWLVGAAIPWAVRAGGRCADLLCLDYEAAFGDPLDEVRERWRIVALPKRGEGV